MQIKQTIKNRDKFWSDNRFLNWKILNYFNKILNSYSSGYRQNITKSHFNKKILNNFNGLQNWNFLVLWRKWTQAMGMKQNQTFFLGTYSNLTPYLFLSKNIKVIQWLSKSRFFRFMTKVKVNQNNGSETKSDIFPWDIFKSDTISF